MAYLVYENSDEKTQLFFGCLLIVAIVFVCVSALCYWISDKIKKNKK